jgi:hypothetical protein
MEKNPCVIKPPRCAILPSPEKLRTSFTSPDQDETNTQGDFHKVWKWLTSSNLFNAQFYEHVQVPTDDDKHLGDAVYENLIKVAFGSVFEIHDTVQPEDEEEMVLLYYAGHGLSEKGAKELNEANLIDEHLTSPFPRLDKVGIANSEQYFAAAHQTVKGGELCLHHFGFCDLQGLLTPWIADMKRTSVKAPDRVKKNKHLVVVVDSCYSGKLVEDLEELALKSGPWKEHGCTVTVQSASSSNEPTFGGYFTPCFVHFNKPENQEKLQKLKQKWDEKSEIEKNAYRAVDLPSPQVATTMPSEKLRSGEDDPILVLPVIQGVQLTLFRDAGFFKFCFLSFSGIVGFKARALTLEAGKTFLLHAKFTILDYKLMKMKKNGTPMALVLVEDPKDQAGPVVCVHIHFHKRNRSNLRNVSGVNLIHHNRPTKVGHEGNLFLEATPNDKLNFFPEDAAKYRHLVQQCKNYVDGTEPGRWADLSRWNMGYYDLGVNQKFRLKEISAWMDDYVKKMISENSVSTMEVKCPGYVIVLPVLICMVIYSWLL